MKRLLVLALLVTASPFSRAADTRLLDAIRSADSTAIRRVIQSIPPVDVRDASGATALMYAALYASVDDMRLLVDRGAEVNAATPTGATALMWAAYDQTRVRFL